MNRTWHNITTSRAGTGVLRGAVCIAVAQLPAQVTHLTSHMGNVGKDFAHGGGGSDG